jgi:hypothetical protein
MNARNSLAALLIISAVLLGVLIPGGPIETRSFSQISPAILLGFNTILTILGLGSVVLAYLALNRRKGAYMLSVFFGVANFLVYALDLLGIFPVSPDSMPRILRWIEVAGIVVSFPLISLSMQLALTLDNTVNSRTEIPKSRYLSLIFLMAMAAIGIITFATREAMR